MKKILVFVCVLLIAFAGLSGCGKSDAGKSDNEKLEDYLAKNQAGFDQLKESFKDQMGFEVTAEGSSIVYSYTFVDHIPDVEALKAGMDAEIPNQEAAMRLVLGELEEIGIENPTVIYRYFNDDGTEITSYEFK